MCVEASPIPAIGKVKWRSPSMRATFIECFCGGTWWSSVPIMPIATGCPVCKQQYWCDATDINQSGYPVYPVIPEIIFETMSDEL